MGRACSNGLGRSALVAVALAFLSGCAQLVPPTLTADEDPLDVIYVAKHDSISASSRHVRPLPASAYKRQWFFLARRGRPRAIPPPPKVDQVLANKLGLLGLNTRVEILVSFVDTVTSVRFPRLQPTQVRTAVFNKHQLDTTAFVIAEMGKRRSARYQADTTMMDSLGARIIKVHWLVQTVLAELAAGKVNALAARPEVVHIRLNEGLEAPHHDNETSNDMATSAADIGMDSYYDLCPGGYMAMLDTGVRTTHCELCHPGMLCMIADCVSGAGLGLDNAHCSPWNSFCHAPGDGDTYSDGHGTSTAAILVGNGADPSGSTAQQSAATPSNAFFKGITTASLDCFRVYNPDGKVNPDAAITGFEEAMRRLTNVVVAEMQDTSAIDNADLGSTADRAFESGIVVIAANGNSNLAATGYPARCRGVIGVGGYSVQFGTDEPGAWGKVPDRRIKPDVLAPTGTETAKGSGDQDVWYFPGTSGAVPYAAGAALMLRNWIVADELTPSFDPGQTYAHLILAGSEVGPFSSHSKIGAGRLRLPKHGTSQWGKVWVSEATRAVDIPIDIPAPDDITKLAAAIWWPEQAPVPGGITDTHNDVDLEIVSPGLFGTVRAKSNGGNGVFERAVVTGSPTLSGKWILRVKSFTQRTGPQRVYWAASLTK
jgi:hypothetical protein